MSLTAPDMTYDEQSINEVFVCWGGNGKADDCDSVAVVTEATSESHAPETIPVSPYRPNSPMDSSHTGTVLNELMKKYPDFIPSRLPAVPKKRAQPVCRFVNFLGTRKPPTPRPTAAPTKAPAAVMNPSPYPTSAPTSYSRPDKRQKVVDRPGSGPTMLVSAHPTLGPSPPRSRIGF